MLRRKYKFKLPDSIIVASTFFKNIPLITADKQFKKVEEIDVIIYDL